MKFKTILSISVFAAITILPFSASAADVEKNPEAKAPVVEMQADKASAKKAKSHSHMEEKTGIPASQQPSANKSDKGSPAMDSSKHYHPRDGK